MIDKRYLLMIKAGRESFQKLKSIKDENELNKSIDSLNRDFERAITQIALIEEVNDKSKLYINKVYDKVNDSSKNIMKEISKEIFPNNNWFNN